MRDFWDATGASALRIVAAFLSGLSNETAGRIGRFLGGCAFYFNSRRRVAYADLKAAFGPRFTEKERWQIVKKQYQHIVQSGIEILRLPVLSRMPAKQLFEVHTSEQFFKELAENQGAIYLTGHFGNWEMLQLFARSENRSLFVLAREQKFQRMNEIVNQIREAAGFQVISTGMGVRGLFRALRRKEMIGLLGDQDAGKTGGLILRLLGRKTTVPAGAFELAARAGVRLYPIFMVRRGTQTFYDIYVYPALKFQSDAAEEMTAGAGRYVELLEDFVSKHPEQWLWGVKRWKYSWTKRILILSDGKPGHVKQSEGVAAQFARIETQYDRPGMEYPTRILKAEYKSPMHRVLFSCFSIFFIPFAQGRLRYLKWFFKKETADALMNACADFIISTGSSLVPLNLSLARDCRAKSVVIMKPSFPFNFFKYDLALVPAHDQGMVPEGTLRTLITPARMEREQMENAAGKLAASVKAPEKIKVSVFLGGPTRRFQIRLKEVKELFSVLSRIAPKLGDFAVTTSRRTPDEISDFLKKETAHDPHCRLAVIAKDDARPEVAVGLMALADVLIVTEDSVSMISEALRSGKRVVVLSLGSEGLPEKHRRFKEILAKEAAVTAATLENLEAKLLKLHEQTHSDLVMRQDQMLKKRLQEIL